METETLVYIAPEQILADDNSRFNLKKSRIEALKSSILESGGVLTPIEVEPLEKPEGKALYRLTSGFYRHGAVDSLNKEQKAGLSLPAIVRPLGGDSLQRLKHQLAENMERENQSPMDQAVAVKKLLDAGLSRGEVRRIFSRPSRSKGSVLQPASNAWVNIILRLLELPKAIQEKIHDGRVGVAAAYELGKVTPEKRAAVIERAEAEVNRQLDIERKDEEKYLMAEKRVSEAQSKERETLTQVDQTRAEVAKAQALIDEKTTVLRTIQKEPFLDLEEKAKRELLERQKAAETDVKGAQKLLKDKQNELSKLLVKAKTAAEIAAEQTAKLEAARKNLKPKSKATEKAVGPEDVKRAAKAVGAGIGQVALMAADMRMALKDVAAVKEYPRVAAIGEAVLQCFNGGPTVKELIHDLAVITGEVVNHHTPTASSAPAPKPGATKAAAPAKGGKSAAA